MPAIIVTFVVGAVAFGALGLAVAAFAPNGDAAVAIANATLLPAAFVSSVFIPLDDPSTLVKVVGSLLPLKPFALAFQDAVHTTTFADSWSWGRLVVVALWGVAGHGPRAAILHVGATPTASRTRRKQLTVQTRVSAQPPGTTPSVRTKRDANRQRPSSFGTRRSR